MLLDLIMPEMDGLTLLERLQADSGDRKCPKVIMISAVSEESMVREAFRLGVSYYMIKPFLPEVLLGRIKALMLPEEEKPGSPGRFFPVRICALPSGGDGDRNCADAAPDRRSGAYPWLCLSERGGGHGFGGCGNPAVGNRETVSGIGREI